MNPGLCVSGIHSKVRIKTNQGTPNQTLLIKESQLKMNQWTMTFLYFSKFKNLEKNFNEED